MPNSKTFVRITNKDIYNNIEDTKLAIANFKIDNEDHHAKIINRLDITNGNVKTNKWVARTAITLALLVLGWFVAHLAASI